MSVVAAAAIACGVGATPPDNAPTYALDSALVYKAEIALALFLGGYLLVAAVVLAIQGRTVGKVSTGGIELPAELSSSVFDQQAMIEWQEQIQQRLTERDERLSEQVSKLRADFDRVHPDHDSHEE